MKSGRKDPLKTEKTQCIKRIEKEVRNSGVPYGFRGEKMHCIATARITDECFGGRITAFYVSLLKEIMEAAGPYQDLEEGLSDMGGNLAGINCAVENKCENEDPCSGKTDPSWRWASCCRSKGY